MLVSWTTYGATVLLLLLLLRSRGDLLVRPTDIYILSNSSLLFVDNSNSKNRNAPWWWFELLKYRLYCSTIAFMVVAFEFLILKYQSTVTRAIPVAIFLLLSSFYNINLLCRGNLLCQSKPGRMCLSLKIFQCFLCRSPAFQVFPIFLDQFSLFLKYLYRTPWPPKEKVLLHDTQRFYEEKAGPCRIFHLSSEKVFDRLPIICKTILWFILNRIIIKISWMDYWRITIKIKCNNE